MARIIIVSVRKDVIRYGDKVEIINPEVFIRCGYPWTKRFVKENIITDKQREAIRVMLNAFNVNLPKTIDEFIGLYYNKQREDPIFDEIMDVMASSILKSNGWGGNKRTIHTELREDLRGKQVLPTIEKLLKLEHTILAVHIVKKHM